MLNQGDRHMQILQIIKLLDYGVCSEARRASSYRKHGSADSDKISTVQSIEGEHYHQQE
jgi:hypothetical protein